MATYIKVTPRGDTKSHIVLATLKDFYISQGAKIEKPTQEEIYAAVPQERPAGAAPAQPNANVYAEQKTEIKELRHAIDTLDQDIKAKDETIAQQSAELADLRTKLEAAETTIAESERVIETLRKELANAAKAKTAKAKTETDTPVE